MKYLIPVFAILLLLTRTTAAQEENRKPRLLRETVQTATTPGQELQKPEKRALGIPSGQPPRDKLQACQSISRNVTKKATNITASVNKFVEKSDSIVERVEEFYQNKLVSQGKTLNNHDTLLSNIQTKKTLVLDSVTDLNSTASQFTCNESSPGLSMSDMREKMKAVRKNLHEYKVASKNFVVAVHKLSSDGEPLPTISVEPTITPALSTP